MNIRILTMRSTAFRDADLIIVLGTRMNYIIGHAAPPRFNGNAKIARIDIDADEIATAPRKVDIGIVGDCKAVLRQLHRCGTKRKLMRIISPRGAKLSDGETAKRQAPGANKPMDDIRSIRCGCARRSRISCSATPSWWSTGRKS